MHDGGDRGGACLLGCGYGPGGGHAHRLQIEILALAQAHHQHPRRWQRAIRPQQRGVAQCAAAIAQLDELADAAVQGLIHRAGGAAGLGDVLEEIDDDQIGLSRLNTALLYLHVHCIFLVLHMVS